MYSSDGATPQIFSGLSGVGADNTERERATNANANDDARRRGSRNESVASRRARTNSHPPMRECITSINQSVARLRSASVWRRDNLARDACVDAARVGVSRARAMDARILDASVRLERVERLVRAVNDGGCRRGGCLSPRRGRRVPRVRCGENADGVRGLLATKNIASGERVLAVAVPERALVDDPSDSTRTWSRQLARRAWRQARRGRDRRR